MIDSFIYSNKGGRSKNEDFVSEKEINNGKIFVLADGLGGHQYGELASKCVVDTILDNFQLLDDTNFEEMITQKVEDANNNLLILQKKYNCSMKSTMVLLSINDNNAYWTHVGDSRLYYIHNNDIRDITDDHSVAFKKYKSGIITRAQIGTDEDQSCLLNVLGNTDIKIDEIDSQKIIPGDAFLLCSDGLWEYVYDNEILFDYLKSDNAENWAKLLLLRALKRIKDDNDNLSLITAMVI